MRVEHFAPTVGEILETRVNATINLCECREREIVLRRVYNYMHICRGRAIVRNKLTERETEKIF